MLPLVKLGGATDCLPGGSAVPETSIVQSSRSGDRPDDVTDPLLWALALDVADAHAPSEGECVQLQCAGQTWPCGAWTNAQRALTAARGGRPESTRAYVRPIADSIPLLPPTPSPWQAPAAEQPESAVA